MNLGHQIKYFRQQLLLLRRFQLTNYMFHDKQYQTGKMIRVILTCIIC